jgi:hypothetical protein
MSYATTPNAGLAIRASDAEREQTVALLQRNFAEGRLTQAELEERAGAAYAALTRAQLRDLTADLPSAQKQPRPVLHLDPRLLCVLLWVCPPAGLIYLLLSLRKQPATADAAAGGSAPAQERLICHSQPADTNTAIIRPESVCAYCDQLVTFLARILTGCDPLGN